MANDLWRLWKKGILFALLEFVLMILWRVIAGATVVVKEIATGYASLVGGTFIVLGFVIVLIVQPIIFGFMIEKVNQWVK